MPLPVSQLMGAMGSMKKAGVPPALGKIGGALGGQVGAMGKTYGAQLAGAAKAGLNQRVAHMASGLTAKIAGAPPTPTPTGVQNAKPPTMPCHCPM